jgi:RNA polymerase sigma factor (sigma-70 family)
MKEHHQLVKDCLKQKLTAQKELYHLFAPAMLGVCYRYTKSIPDAEDVLQEGFVKVFTQLHQYKQEGELGAWIRRIMVNTAINYLKKHRRYQADLSFLEGGLHPVDMPEVELTLSIKEITELIRQLPPGYQTIFNLHGIEGYTHVEIGKMLGINEGTSRSQYSRARGLLSEWIKKQEMTTKNIVYAGK